MSVIRIFSRRMAIRHRLSKHEDPEIRKNAHSENKTDPEEDLGLDETDDSESAVTDQPSYENFSQIGCFITRHGPSFANRIDPG